MQEVSILTPIHGRKYTTCYHLFCYSFVLFLFLLTSFCILNIGKEERGVAH